MYLVIYFVVHKTQTDILTSLFLCPDVNQDIKFDIKKKKNIFTVPKDKLVLKVDQ